MTRSEFMESLQRSLAGKLSGSSVNENVRYYQEYFDTQIRMGHSEEEVTASLGDPRLLAKTIIEAGKYKGRGFGSAQPEYDEVYEDDSQDNGSETVKRKEYRLPGWLIAILVLLVVIFVSGVVGSILTALLPVIIPVLCIVLIVKWIYGRQ